MEIVKTEGCIAYSTTINGKDILECTFEEKKKLLHELIENIPEIVDDAGSRYDVDVFFDRAAEHFGEFDHLYDCEECGDSVISYTLTTDSEAISPDVVNELIKDDVEDTDKISDGYHTFGELYEYRKLYNAAFLNELARQGKCNVHKSTKHSDGEDCFGGGWFIVMADLPTGQISNHYKIEDWDLFDCEARERAEEWDGHTPEDVAKRIERYIKGQ